MADSAALVGALRAAGEATPLERSYTYESTTQRLSTVTTTLNGATTLEDDTYTWLAAGALGRVTSAAVADRTSFASCTTYDELGRLRHAWTGAVAPRRRRRKDGAGKACDRLIERQHAIERVFGGPHVAVEKE